MSNLTKDQTWELLEIHTLLGDTSSENDGYGFNLLTEFIEKHGFATQEKKVENENV
jgi:hypothetical protein